MDSSSSSGEQQIKPSNFIMVDEAIGGGSKHTHITSNDRPINSLKKIFGTRLEVESINKSRNPGISVARAIRKMTESYKGDLASTSQRVDWPELVWIPGLPEMLIPELG